MIKKILIFSLILTIALIISWEIFYFVYRGQFSLSLFNPKPTPTSFPSPTPTLTVEFVASPSAYATDEAVLKIEEQLKIIGKELDQVDLDEHSLNPPFLDLKVKL